MCCCITKRRLSIRRRSLTGASGIFENHRAGLVVIEVPDTLLPPEDAVRSCFFNSQMVTLPDGSLAFIAPVECLEMATAAAAIELFGQRLPGLTVHFVDVRESMRNGGGPACLRLRWS